MRRIVFKSKIHRATVTDANLHYEGSITVDRDLLDAADILPNEQVHVWDVTSGARIVTYALPGERGSGVVCVNGAGAHLIKKGSLVIVATFTTMKTKEAKKYEPTVVFVDGSNKLKDHADEPTEFKMELPTAAEVDEETPFAPEPIPVRRSRRKPA